MVDELLVGERRLRVVVAPAQQRVARQPLEVPPVLLDVLAVVALRPGEAEHPLLQDRVVAVPEREREAELVADVGDAGHPVLVPAVGARAGVVVRERVPGVAALGVVLAHRAPGALAQVRAPLVPRVRGEEVVLGAAGRLGEARVLGGLGGCFGIAISPSGVERSQVEEVPGPRVERDVEPVAEVVAAALVAPRRSTRRRAATPAAQVVPRQRDVAGRRRVAEVHDDELARTSPRQPQATRFCHVSLPSQPLRSPSCHSPLRKTGSRERREQPLVERRAGRRRAARRAGGRGRPAAAPCRPSSWPSWTSRAPVWRQRRHRRGARLRRAGTSPPPAARRGSR